MSNSAADEMMVQPTANRPKLSDCGNKDRLSNLPDCIILRILSLLNTRQAVQTCVLSPRYEDLWKQLSVFKFHSRDFPTIDIFANFVSNFLSLRDSSIPMQSFHFCHIGCLDPQLIKRAADYAISHNVQQFGLYVYCDFEQLPVTIFSCHTITCLELTIYPGQGLGPKPVFPKSFSLPALTTLNLGNFAFCPTDNNSRAEPFSAFNRLNTSVLRQCSVRVAPTLCISNATLVNFTMHSHSYESYKIELCTPSLDTFTYIGIVYQKVFGSSLSYVKHVDIDAQVMFLEMRSPQLLLSLLLEFVNTKSLTVTASTLQVLFFNANLLNMKLPSSLGNLKCLKVKKEPLSYDLLNILNYLKLKKIRSPKKAAKLQKSFEAGLEPSAPIPDGTVNFLIQNSPFAEVEIIDCT